MVREGFPEEVTFKLRPEGRTNGLGRKDENQQSRAAGKTSMRAVRGNFQQPQGARVLLRAEGEARGGQDWPGCLLSTQKEGGLALEQPNQTEKWKWVINSRK